MVGFGGKCGNARLPGIGMVERKLGGSHLSGQIKATSWKRRENPILDKLMVWRRCLKDVYHGLYRIAKNKQTLVKNCYKVRNNVVSWQLEFCRNLRVFGQDSLDELKELLGDFPLSTEEENELLRAGDSSRAFSVKSVTDLAPNQQTREILYCA